MVAFFVSERPNLKLKQQQPKEFIDYCIDTCDLYLFPPSICAQRCIASTELRTEWEKQKKRKGKRLCYSLVPSGPFFASLLTSPHQGPGPEFVSRLFFPLFLNALTPSGNRNSRRKL